MVAEFVRRCDVDVMMLAGRYTLLEQGALDELLPLAEERGVGIVAAAIYNSGLLSAPRVQPGATYDYAPASDALIARVNAIAEVCERHGVTLPEAAVAYPLRHPAVVSVVVGTRTPAQLASTVERYETEVPEALWAELAETGLVRGLGSTGLGSTGLGSTESGSAASGSTSAR
jgi:D-threo-aldose 1-dehydrogenase